MSEKSESQMIYDNYRNEVLERQRVNSSNFDKVILSLSTAIIGVSTSFIDNVIDLSKASDIFLLKYSWISFSLVIISTVISFLVSQKALDKQLEYAEKYYIDNKDEYFNKRSIWAKITNFLNKFSGLIFIVAIILLIVFINLNI